MELGEGRAESSSSSGVRLCGKGCGRPAFRTYDTCCTHCRGPDGPHAYDCAKKACKRSLSSVDGGGVVVLCVIKAHLFRSFDTVGLMDPFAIVEYLPSGKEDMKVEIGRTKSAWQEHMNPVWSHMCRGAIYRGPGSGDSVKLRVLEENFGGLGVPTFCGEVVSSLEELLADVADVSAGVKTSRPRALPLVKRGENTGTVTVQAVLHHAASRHLKTADLSALTGMEQPMTLVDPSLFETPVQRLGVSGGTAPFFSLRLVSPKEGQTAAHWIGKDLSRATDEIGFYEKRMALSQAGSHGMGELFGFMFDYAGVLECAEAGTKPGAPKLQLLVLRNLRDGCRGFRMLDIKVGEKTAAAGWQGKSWFAAKRQGVVDGLTNSQAEGFRLEGFDGQPPAIQSMDPLLDFGGVREHSKKLGKKAERLMLQRMPGAEMFAHLMDVHQEPPDAEDVRKTLTPTELAEIVMGEMARQLVRLSVACRSSPAPQKWIGSSVALGFDSGHLPPRGSPVEDIHKTVRVNIFDWGRSELNTLEHHAAMAAEDQADRLEYWKFYSGGINRLAWEAARFYWHHFCNTGGWSELQITVYDFDSHSANDYIGQVRLPLAECGETTVPLHNAAGYAVSGKSGPASLAYSVSWRSLPEGSRLRGAWRIHLLRAQNLPGLDGVISEHTSDPFVSLLALSGDGQFQCQQSSCVVARNVNPSWDETFEFPVAVGPPEHLTSKLDLAGVKAASVFPPADSPETPLQDHSQARAQWTAALDKACGRRSFMWTSA